MKKSYENLLVLLIAGIAASFIYYLFFYTPNGHMSKYKKLYLKHDYKRYSEIVSNKEFEKIQIYVACKNNYNGTSKLFKVEELGADSKDICLYLEKFPRSEGWMILFSVHPRH